jgi:hypothetical protein
MDDGLKEWHALCRKIAEEFVLAEIMQNVNEAQVSVESALKYYYSRDEFIDEHGTEEQRRDMIDGRIAERILTGENAGYDPFYDPNIREMMHRLRAASPTLVNPK